jgi:hypothetical protein
VVLLVTVLGTGRVLGASEGFGLEDPTLRAVPGPGCKVELEVQPGLYAAVPYSALVVVPAPVDPKFVVPPVGKAKGRVIPPPAIELVPLQRR